MAGLALVPVLPRSWRLHLTTAMGHCLITLDACRLWSRWLPRTCWTRCTLAACAARWPRWRRTPAATLWCRRWRAPPRARSRCSPVRTLISWLDAHIKTQIKHSRAKGKLTALVMLTCRGVVAVKKQVWVGISLPRCMFPYHPAGAVMLQMIRS